MHSDTKLEDSDDSSSAHENGSVQIPSGDGGTGGEGSPSTLRTREERLEIIVNRLTSWTCASEAQLRKAQEDTLELLRDSFNGWRDLCADDMRWYYDDLNKDDDSSSDVAVSSNEPPDPNKRGSSKKVNFVETYSISPRRSSISMNRVGCGIPSDWDDKNIKAGRRHSTGSSRFFDCSPYKNDYSNGDEASTKGSTITQERSPKRDSLGSRESIGPHVVQLSNTSLNSNTPRLKEQDVGAGAWFCCVARQL